jgi:hypothetical protein
VTVDLAAERLRERIAIEGARISYRQNCESMQRVHISPVIGKRKAASVKPEDVERLASRMLAKGSSPKTVRNVMTFLYSVFELAVKKGWSPANPVADAARPRRRRAGDADPDLQFLRLSELDAVIDAIPDHTVDRDALGPVLRLVILAAATTGLRQSELLGLRWRDVDLRAQRIRVRNAPSARTGADGVIGANAYLWVPADRPEAELTIYPADTLTQAKAFYRRHNAMAGVQTLVDGGWSVEPNFHFGSFQRGYCWLCNERPLDEYMRLWIDRIAGEGAVPRAGWDRYWSWLESERIACSEDRPEFDRIFVMSKRSDAVPRPGLKLSRRWPLARASAPGGEPDFARDVREALDEALGAFDASRS